MTLSVIGAVEPTLRKEEVERASRKRPDSLDAYDLFLRALPFAATAMPENADKALELLEQAAIAMFVHLATGCRSTHSNSPTYLQYRTPPRNSSIQLFNPAKHSQRSLAQAEVAINSFTRPWIYHNLTRSQEPDIIKTSTTEGLKRLWKRSTRHQQI